METSSVTRWAIVFSIIAILLIIVFFTLGDVTEQLLNKRIKNSENLLMISGIIVIGLMLDFALPIPSSLMNVTAGALLGFVGGTLASWSGMTLSCLLGYSIGAIGRTLTTQNFTTYDDFKRSAIISEKITASLLLIMRAVPVLAETSTIAAGIARMPLRKFIPIVGLGNLGISGIYAYVGAFSLEANSFYLAFMTMALLPLAAIFIYYVYTILSIRSNPP